MSSELFNMGKSFELPISHNYSSSQNLVLVRSASPKHSTKITARLENLLAIHKKIRLHLTHERPLTKFELRKLLAILKRTDCSSPKNQKIAQSAHDILVKCIYSQTSKNKDRNSQRNISNTTSDSSTTDEHQTSENASDDSDAKQQLLLDIISGAEYKTENSLEYALNEPISTSHQTELAQYMDLGSQGTSDDIDGQQLSMPASSEKTYNSDNCSKYTLTQYVPTAHQTQLEQYMDLGSQVTSDDLDGQQLSIDASFEKAYNSDKCSKYTLTQNAPTTAHQTELKQYMYPGSQGTSDVPTAHQTELEPWTMDLGSQGTSDDIDDQQVSMPASSEKTYNSDNCSKYTLTQYVPTAHQTQLEQYTDLGSQVASDDIDGQQTYNSDKCLKYTITQNAQTAHQTELKQYIDLGSQGTSDNIDGQQMSVDASSKKTYNSDKCSKYTLTQNVPTARQTELEHYMDLESQGTSDGIDSQQLSIDASSKETYNSEKYSKYTLSLNASTAHQSDLKQYMDAISQGTSDDIDGKQLDYLELDTSEIRCTTANAFLHNESKYHQTASNHQLNVTSASNIFSGQTIKDDGMVSFFKGMPSSNDSNITPIGTNLGLSEVFFKRQELSLNTNIDNDRFGNDGANALTEPFSVPVMLENRHSDDCQRSIKLRLADVKFDSNTVSIPIELLTNLNFGSDEGQSQNDRKSKSPGIPIIDHLHQHPFTLTQSSLNHSQESSLNTNNIEWVTSPNDDRYTTSKLVNQQLKKSSCFNISKSNIDISSITSRNTETPIFNIEVQVTNSEEPTLNKDGRNFKGTMSADIELDVQEPSLPLEVYYRSNNTELKPQRNLSNVAVATVNGKHFEYAAWNSPINDVNDRKENAWLTPPTDSRNKNVDSEPPDLQQCECVPVEDAMELCKSLMDEEEDSEMTENEQRYLEMVANGVETETNNFIFDQKKIRKIVSETNVDDSEQESFVFNLDADSDGDLIEATPFENLRKILFTEKIKTILPKNVETQISTKGPRIISETKDIIIEETPYSIGETEDIIEKTPGIDGKYSVKIMPRVLTPFCKKQSNPYKKWPRSNTFQDMYKSNYQRKSPRIERGKTDIIKKIKVNEEEEKEKENEEKKEDKEDVSQSQSLGIFTEDQYNNVIDKPTAADPGEPSTSKRLPNDSSANSCQPTANNPDKNEPTTSKYQKMIQSENIVLIDGSFAKTSEDMDTTQDDIEEEEESFEEIARKFEEKIERKRNKYKEVWSSKPVSEKVSLKYVKKFGVNIFEDPVSSLLNIGYKANANNFYFPRLTKKEMKEKLKTSSEQAKILDDALIKMIDLQISSSSSENYQFKIARDTAGSDDSSDEEEQAKDKRMLEEIKIKSRLEMKKFMDDMEKERKEEMRLKKETVLLEQDDDDEQVEGKQSTNIEEPRKLVELLRKTVDYSWLK